MKYIATFKTSVQITECDFKIINPVLELDENTTLKEINEWYNSIDSPNNKMEVTLIKL